MEKKELKHVSILGIILSIVGFLGFLFGIYAVTLRQLEFGYGVIVSSLLMFAVAELVYHAQYQTKILLELLKK